MSDVLDLSTFLTSSVTVSELNLHIKRVLDSHDEVQGLWVRGEIADLHLHTRSGHLYFCLKDAESRLSCVMFRSDAASMESVPQEGASVAAFGDVSVYTRGGVYQLYVRRLASLGDGMLSFSFEEVKRRLAADGLFDMSRKRALPRFPMRVAVVTSPEGAAIKDIVAVVGRRCPLTELIVVPCVVQGDLAVDSIVSALDRAAGDCRFDLGILTRGGGAADDLWVFNDERVARRLAAMPFPMICAVGHERDFTICDLVADVRAPTPSAAAEIAVPDMSAVLENVSHSIARAMLALTGSIHMRKSAVDRLGSSWVFRRPEMLVHGRRQALDETIHRLDSAIRQIMDPRLSKLDILAGRLDSSSPRSILHRGYSLVFNSRTGELVTKLSHVSPGDQIEVIVTDGVVEAEVRIAGGGSCGKS